MGRKLAEFRSRLALEKGLTRAILPSIRVLVVGSFLRWLSCAPQWQFVERPVARGRRAAETVVAVDGVSNTVLHLSRRQTIMGCALTSGTAPIGRARAAALPDEVTLYFGTGNFWHLQHRLAYKEALTLKRRGPDITSIVGFAGGVKVGELDRICFRGFGGAPEASKLGHGQVVQLSLPTDKVTDFAAVFFEEVSQRRATERGDGYRPMIGLRQGMKSPLWPLIAAANVNGTQVEKGQGDETGSTKVDTPEVVYVYDSRFLPFRPAEVYNQFKQDPIEKSYDPDYKALNDVLRSIGSISSNGCP